MISIIIIILMRNDTNMLHTLRAQCCAEHVREAAAATATAAASPAASRREGVLRDPVA